MPRAQKGEHGEDTSRAVVAPPLETERDRRTRRPRHASSDEEEEVVINKRGRTQPQESEDSDTSEMTVDVTESSETNEVIRREVLKIFHDYEENPRHNSLGQIESYTDNTKLT